MFATSCFGHMFGDNCQNPQHIVPAARSIATPLPSCMGLFPPAHAPDSHSIPDPMQHKGRPDVSKTQTLHVNVYHPNSSNRVQNPASTSFHSNKGCPWASVPPEIHSLMGTMSFTFQDGCTALLGPLRDTRGAFAGRQVF